MIAGASIVGIVAALQGFLPGFDKDAGLHPQLAILSGLGDFGAEYLSVAVLLGLCALMYHGARSNNGDSPKS